MFDSAAIIAIVGVLGTAIGGILWIVKYFAQTLSVDLQEHTKAATEQTASNLALQKSVDSFDTYLRERNGRDNEVHKELMATMGGMPEKFSSAVQAIADQAVNQITSTITVQEQHVEHQHVDNETVSAKTKGVKK